jgi:hypothetical protein
VAQLTRLVSGSLYRAPPVLFISVRLTPYAASRALSFLILTLGHGATVRETASNHYHRLTLARALRRAVHAAGPPAESKVMQAEQAYLSCNTPYAADFTEPLMASYPAANFFTRLAGDATHA